MCEKVRFSQIQSHLTIDWGMNSCIIIITIVVLFPSWKRGEHQSRKHINNHHLS